MNPLCLRVSVFDSKKHSLRRSRERGCCGFGLEFEDDVTTTSFYIKSKLVPTFEYRIGDAIVKRNGKDCWLIGKKNRMKIHRFSPAAHRRSVGFYVILFRLQRLFLFITFAGRFYLGGHVFPLPVFEIGNKARRKSVQPFHRLPRFCFVEHCYIYHAVF